MSAVLGMACEEHSITALHLKVGIIKTMRCIYKYFTIQINRYFHLSLMPPNISESNFCHIYPSSSCSPILQDFPPFFNLCL